MILFHFESLKNRCKFIKVSIVSTPARVLCDLNHEILFRSNLHCLSARWRTPCPVQGCSWGVHQWCPRGSGSPIGWRNPPSPPSLSHVHFNFTQDAQTFASYKLACRVTKFFIICGQPLFLFAILLHIIFCCLGYTRILFCCKEMTV